MTVCRVWRILASTRATDGRNRWSLRLPQWWSCPVVGSPYRCSYDLPVVPGSSKFIASCPSPETTDQLQGPVSGHRATSGERSEASVSSGQGATSTPTSRRGDGQPDPLGSPGSAEVRNYLPAIPSRLTPHRRGTSVNFCPRNKSIILQIVNIY